MATMTICLLAIVAISSVGSSVAVQEALAALGQHYATQDARIEALEKTVAIIMQTLKPVNLALNKATDQISTYTQASTGKSGLSTHAVDGNNSDNWYDESAGCSHTLSVHNAWWKVDLGKQLYVKKVVITPRGDCCTNRLSNFDVLIQPNKGDAWENAAHYPGTAAAGKKITIVFPETMLAEVIKIQLKGTNFLELCEVQVFEF